MGERWQNHHPTRRKDGGRHTVRVTIENHATIHLQEFLTTGDKDELDAALGQFGNMTGEEREKFHQMVEVRIGIKVKFC